VEEPKGEKKGKEEEFTGFTVGGSRGARNFSGGCRNKGGGGGFSSYRSGVKVGLEPALVCAAPSGGGREAAGGPAHLPQYNL
jgi:hypothetical protein